MKSDEKSHGLDTKALLSTLWIFVLFNFIFRDIHEFAKPEFLAELITGTFNGVRVTEEALLVGGIMIEIVIVMVLLSRVLDYRLNRWANMMAGTVTIVLIVVNGPGDLDDIFFAVVEVVALLFIVWTAWKWPKEEGLISSDVGDQPVVDPVLFDITK